MKTSLHLGAVAIAAVLATASVASDYTREPSSERKQAFQKAQQLVTDSLLVSGTNRTAMLTDAQKACDGLLWVQDDIFAWSLVLHARIKFMQGETNRAVQILDEYNAELDKATKAMVTRGTQTNDTPAAEAARLRKDIGPAGNGKH